MGICFEKERLTGLSFNLQTVMNTAPADIAQGDWKTIALIV
jgi:hypothetical protein